MPWKTDEDPSHLPVELTINGRAVAARPGQTILELVREQHLDTIPTLCHEPGLPPFGSCFLCVVEVKDARGLLPSCTTRVRDGMEVVTRNDRITRARKTALALLLSDHYADCACPGQLACPAGVDVQGYLAPCESWPLPGGPAPDPGAQPPARRLRKGVRAKVRSGMPPQPGGRVRRDQPGEAFRVRARERPPGAAAPNGEAGRRRGGRSGGPDLRVLPVPAGPLGHDLRGDAPPGRDAQVRYSRVPSSPGGARCGHRRDPGPRCGSRLQPQARQGVHAAGTAGGGIPRDLPGSGRAPWQEAGRAGRGCPGDRIGPGFPEGHRTARAKASARKGRGGGGRELRRGRRTDRRPLRRGGCLHPVPPVPQGDAGLPRGSGRGGAGRSASYDARRAGGGDPGRGDRPVGGHPVRPHGARRARSEAGGAGPCPSRVPSSRSRAPSPFPRSARRPIRICSPGNRKTAVPPSAPRAPSRRTRPRWRAAFPAYSPAATR